MAYENLGKVVPLPVASALVQFTMVTLTRTVGLAPVVVQSANDGPVTGVLQNTPLAGSASGDADAVADVMIGPGITKVKSGGVFAVGDFLESDASGQAIFGATGGHIVGQAVEASAASGNIVTMLFFGAGGQSTAP